MTATESQMTRIGTTTTTESQTHRTLDPRITTTTESPPPKTKTMTATEATTVVMPLPEVEPDFIR